MCVQNLNIVALPIPEIIGVLKKFVQSLDTSTPPFLPNFLRACVRMDPANVRYLPNLRFVALPVPEIIAIAVLGGVANLQSWGMGGHKGSGMVLFERAFVTSYRPSSP